MPHPPHPLATVPQLLLTPSAQDGLAPQLEDDLRTAGCMLIQEEGVLLDLPQSTLATAQVLLQRFYYVSSMLAFTVNDIAVAALYLASKLCESPVRLRDLLNVHALLLARTRELITRPEVLAQEAERGRKGQLALPMEGWSWKPPSFHDAVYYEMKEALVVNEIQILKRLGFNMQVDLPYSHTVNYCKILDLLRLPSLVQSCWSILNDALLTPLFATHTPATLACTSILLATRRAGVSMPTGWWELFDAQWEDMWGAAGTVMRLWDRWGEGEGGKGKGKQDVWVRAWTLATSKRQVRKWVEKEQEMYGAEA